MTKSSAWIVVAAVFAGLVLLSGCASNDSSYCANGMTLRVDHQGAFCSGFGSGFNFNSRSAPIRQPWWVAS